MARDSTVLNLLMRGGAVCVTFTPALESAQYDELHDLVSEIDSLDHLSEILDKLAQQWQRQLQIDPC
jgi:hypothetical protein